MVKLHSRMPLKSSVVHTGTTRVTGCPHRLLNSRSAGVSEDDVFRETKAVQVLTDAATEVVTKLADKKRAELEAA